MLPLNIKIAYRETLLVVLLLLLGYLFIHYNVYDLISNRERIVAFINSFDPYDQLAFMGVQVFQVVVAPIPGEVTGFIGGYLYGPVMGTLFSTIGLTLGSWVAFGLAHFFGLPLVEKFVKPELVQKFDRFMRKKGALYAFILFLIPGFPKDSLCYVIGLSHIPVGIFLLIVVAGRFFWTLMLSMTGNFARNDQYISVLVIAAVSCVLGIVGYYYRDKWLRWMRHRGKKQS
ncbi:MAG: TVP38/TMEM64 family protein [Syntrophaceae bacterium]|nr:TVP38/TMEM64 family protein [Syntrophaceae bacterium]